MESKLKNDATSDELMINSNDQVRIHITYDEDLNLGDLSETLDLINKAVNDVNRENGASNRKIGKEYSSKVSSVESGSIVLNVVLLVVVPIAVNMLSNAIYDRLKTLKQKKKKDAPNEQKYPISVNGNRNEIHIHIYNASTSTDNN